MKARRSIAVRLALIGGITIVLVGGWVMYGRFASGDRRFQQIKEIRDRMQLVLDRDIRDEDLIVVNTDGTAFKYELLVPHSRERLSRPRIAHHERVPFICEPASLAGNDRYVLFVDGSVDRVSDEKLRELLIQSGSPPEAIERLFVKPPGP